MSRGVYVQRAKSPEIRKEAAELLARIRQAEDHEAMEILEVILEQRNSWLEAWLDSSTQNSTAAQQVAD